MVRGTSVERTQISSEENCELRKPYLSTYTCNE
jgi:hypothetical protein